MRESLIYLSFSAMVVNMTPAMTTASPAWRERRRTNYPAFPTDAKQGWLGRLLDHVQITGVTAVALECARNWTLPHRRIEDDMFLFVTSGHLFVETCGRRSELRRGDGVHYRRGDWHSAAADPSEALTLISFHYTARVFESLTLPAVLNFPDVFRFGQDRQVRLLMDHACRLHALEPAGYRRALESLAGVFLFRLVHEQSDWLQAAPMETKLSDLRRLLPALEQLRTQLTDPPTIPQLAQRCSLSESQFRRVFRRAVGLRPVQYQRRLRMEAACRQLRQTDDTVEAIAEAVGYAEPAFFAHTFKRLMGVSPGKYRLTRGL
jgi:AraC-like DNA-binding protein/quercetin dioxygenase-like cupin family protein